MEGKKIFKEVRNEYLENIMDTYNVGKDEAYQALAEVLDNPCVLNAISKALAEQFYNKNKANPYEEWVQTFLTASVKAKRLEV